MNTIQLIAHKEGQSLLLNQRGLVWLFIYSLILAAFSLLLISNKELSLLDNAQVVYMMAGTVTAAGAAIAIILGSDAYAGEKERGTLIPLLASPMTTNNLLFGKALGLFYAWGIMYLLALPFLWAVGVDGQNLFQAILYLAFFGTPVILGFGLLAISLSARSGNVLSSLLTSLIVFIFSASPLLIGPGLRGTTIGQFIDAINPFSGALNTFDSVIIDSEPFSVQLPRFILVFSWMLLMFFVARWVAKHPRFQ